MKHVRTVADVMTHAVISVNSDAPFKEIVEAMQQWHVSALPVLSARDASPGLSPRET